MSLQYKLREKPQNDKSADVHRYLLFSQSLNTVGWLMKECLYVELMYPCVILQTAILCTKDMPLQHNRTFISVFLSIDP